MVSTTDELVPLLKKLRMSGVLQSVELRTRQATEDDLSNAEFLLRLLSDEVERRDSKQLDVRIRRAIFDGPRSIEDFDLHFNPKIPRPKIIDLATCSFVERKENVLLVGVRAVPRVPMETITLLRGNPTARAAIAMASNAGGFPGDTSHLTRARRDRASAGVDDRFQMSHCARSWRVPRLRNAIAPSWLPSSNRSALLLGGLPGEALRSAVRPHRDP